MRFLGVSSQEADGGQFWWQKPRCVISKVEISGPNTSLCAVQRIRETVGDGAQRTPRGQGHATEASSWCPPWPTLPVEL